MGYSGKCERSICNQDYHDVANFLNSYADILNLTKGDKLPSC